MILAAALPAAGTLPAGAETWLYGLTTTSMEEGNGRIVRVDVETLSSDMQNPTQFEEIATVEYANDFMAGTSVNGLYYCYYNIFGRVDAAFRDARLQDGRLLDNRGGKPCR